MNKQRQPLSSAQAYIEDIRVKLLNPDLPAATREFLETNLSRWVKQYPPPGPHKPDREPSGEHNYRSGRPAKE